MEIKNNLVGIVGSSTKTDKSKETAAAKTTASTTSAKPENKDTLLDAVANTDSVTYEKPTAKTKGNSVVEEAIKMSDARYASLKQMVKDIIEKQGGTFTDISDAKNIKFADESTINAAKEAIGDGGDMSVDNLSDTIINFAKALAESDPSKAEMLKNSFQDGFKAAESAWGGKLPDISYKTYDAVMKKFDEWTNPPKEAAAGDATELVGGKDE